ncbi:hypothetical protein RIF29_15777 [Crotalaria pallida]|uniref:Uncharacterized protein n=1 Tax=Crotalaria pallida TaxID=3830 RepID=A0AAN9FJQ0_CROPI
MSLQPPTELSYAEFLVSILYRVRHFFSLSLTQPRSCAHSPCTSSAPSLFITAVAAASPITKTSVFFQIV